ncbi:hypothetical protein [Ectopseudomonas mendocina]|uniref:hypothetical protein n=1 Tax=Ectopseudomonas mendocina TaxID=300 RepID=UPI0002DB09C1|nr:hypothetical protein [Pseudomonas mendocina]
MRRAHQRFDEALKPIPEAVRAAHPTALESDVLVLKPDEVIAHLEELVAQR